jgi:predicted nucleotidyltransferase
MKRKEFLNKIKQAVLTIDDKAVIILFGSHARGDARKDSDWDILVVTNKQAGVKLQNNIRDRMYDIELEYLQPVSTVIVDKPQWDKISITGFYENVIKEGVAL